MGFILYFISSYRKGNRRRAAILIYNSVNFRLISEFSHKEDRYVLVKGFLDQKEVTFVNVYKSPDQDNSCIREIFQSIAKNNQFQSPPHLRTLEYPNAA